MSACDFINIIIVSTSSLVVENSFKTHTTNQNYYIIMWRVVSFEEDNTVDVVPDFWFKNGYCEWPNKTNRMDSKTSIKRHMKPDEIHFTKYKARSLLTNIATFQEAESKATKAQVTSKLSSNEDEIDIENKN